MTIILSLKAVITKYRKSLQIESLNSELKVVYCFFEGFLYITNWPKALTVLNLWDFIYNNLLVSNIVQFWKEICSMTR